MRDWSGPHRDAEAALDAVLGYVEPERVLEGPVRRPQPIGRDGRAWRWLLVKARDHRPLIVCLLAARFNDGKWYGLAVSEMMGPFVFDPPLGWLDRSPMRLEGYAGVWRRAVLAGVEAAWEVQHGRV